MSGDKEHNIVRENYRPRLVDSRIDDMLSAFGGVLITGPKWCGKSWTGIYHAASSIMLSIPSIRNYIRTSPEDALIGDYPRLIDEWQDVPDLWDLARGRIDLANMKGMYIFTGSSPTPGTNVRHTGTGRFARIRMRTMSLFESGESNGSISLSKLFSDGRVCPTPSTMRYDDIIYLICRGGWPASISVTNDIALTTPFEYVNALISVDFSAITGMRRNPSLTERILRSLARNSASEVRLSTITADVSEGGRSVSEQTVRNYIDSLKDICVIEEQPAWSPSLRSRGRIRTSPKIHFTDPSLAASLLKAPPEILKKDVNTAGLLFESLCHRDLSAYAYASMGNVYHYRDNTGLEIDSIVEMPDGRWGAAEVKLGDFEVDKAARNLLRLNDKVGQKASFLCVITATGLVAYTRDDGVSVIPIGILGP